MKKKILFLSDHPLVPSGVGTQARLLIEGLLATGKYKFICLGGAVNHPDYRLQKIFPEQYGDDWLIQPVNGYGDKNIVRRMLETEKPDVLLFFTDPRQFVWLWEIEDEVRSVCPMVYWHVWDNDPPPSFNKVFYESTDRIVSLSLKTHGLIEALGLRSTYIPHAVSKDVFKPLDEKDVEKFKKDSLGDHANKKFILFWNNRNARRKQTGDVIVAFSKFVKIVGKENASLMMHTSMKDPEGQDVIALAKEFDIEKQLIVSESRVTPEELNMFYNVTDCTINIANNEGFGLSTLECICAGNPIIVHMTGGLQFQIGDWWEGLKNFSDQEKMTELAKKKYKIREGKWFGAPVFTSIRSCTGSQQIPFIYDDRVKHEDIVEALMKMYNLGRSARRALGLEAREWALKTFNQSDVIKRWDALLEEEILKNASKKTCSVTIDSI